MARRKVNPRSSKSSDDSSDDDEQRSQGLFICPEAGCGKAYMRYSAYNAHLIRGQHRQFLDNLSLEDKAKLGYAQRLEKGFQQQPVIQVAVSAVSEQPARKEKGWALRPSTKGGKRFTDRQRSFLIEKYDQGETTGNKCIPEDVSKQMRLLKGSDGTH